MSKSKGIRVLVLRAEYEALRAAVIAYSTERSGESYRLHKEAAHWIKIADKESPPEAADDDFDLQGYGR